MAARSACCLLSLSCRFSADRTAASKMSSSKGFEEIGSAELHGFDGERNIAVYRDDDHRQEHLELLQPAQQIDAADLRHPDIGNDDPDRSSQCSFSRLNA
jgi:hypothetical protein